MTWRAIQTHTLVVALMLLPLGEAFLGSVMKKLHADLTKQVDQAAENLKSPVGVQTAAIKLSSAYSARRVRSQSGVDSRTESGMRFFLREDARCFMVEMNRPGDHVVSSFRVRFHEATLLNATLEVFSPSWKLVSQFDFPPTHPCVRKSTPCLARATPLKSSAHEEHGVESGSYALCFRKSAPSLMSRLFQILRNVSASEELEKDTNCEIELLELTSAPTLLSQRMAAVDDRAAPAPFSQKNNKPSFGPLMIHKTSERLVHKDRIHSIASRLKLLQQDIDDVVRMSLELEARQGIFQSLSNDTFTRTWVCGLVTIFVSLVVLTVERSMIARFLVKRKLV